VSINFENIFIILYHYTSESEIKISTH